MTRLRLCAWAALAVVLSIGAVSAQSDIPQLLDRAETLLQASHSVQARPLFERALEAARQTARDADIARALLGLAEISQREGRAADGRAGVVEALAIAERLGDERRIADA